METLEVNLIIPATNPTGENFSAANPSASGKPHCYFNSSKISFSPKMFTGKILPFNMQHIYFNHRCKSISQMSCCSFLPNYASSLVENLEDFSFIAFFEWNIIPSICDSRCFRDIFFLFLPSRILISLSKQSFIYFDLMDSLS